MKSNKSIGMFDMPNQVISQVSLGLPLQPSISFGKVKYSQNYRENDEN
jgi:hypothetical protein